MLIRRFINASLLVEDHLWCVAIQLMIGLPFQITDKSLRCRDSPDPRAPQGLSYHLKETWRDDDTAFSPGTHF